MWYNLEKLTRRDSDFGMTAKQGTKSLSYLRSVNPRPMRVEWSLFFRRRGERDWGEQYITSRTLGLEQFLSFARVLQADFRLDRAANGVRQNVLSTDLTLLPCRRTRTAIWASLQVSSHQASHRTP